MRMPLCYLRRQRSGVRAKIYAAMVANGAADGLIVVCLRQGTTKPSTAGGGMGSSASPQRPHSLSTPPRCSASLQRLSAAPRCGPESKRRAL